MLPVTILSAVAVWLSCGAAAPLEVDTDAETLLEERHAHHPVPISPQLWARIQRYANFSSASQQLYGDCPYPPYGTVLADYININSTSTQASLFRDDVAKEFIIAFPGTSSQRDEKTDSEYQLAPYSSLGVKPEDCEGCMTHKGFGIAWNSAAERVAHVLHQNIQEYPDYFITITGYSLGAALASLATSSLKGLPLPVRDTFTYGEPRVGNRPYADRIDKISGAHRGKHSPAGSYHRVTHANDGVPQVPRQRAGYRHSRTEYWEHGRNVAETESRVVRCWGQEPANCNDGHPAPQTFVAAHSYYGGIVMGDSSSCGT